MTGHSIRCERCLFIERVSIKIAILIENNVFDALDDIIVTLFAPMEQLWGGTSVTQWEQQAGKDLRIKVEHVDRGKYLVKIPNTIANYQRSASLLKLENIAGVTFIEIAFSAEGRHWIKRGGSQDVVTEIPVTPSDYYGSGSVPMLGLRLNRSRSFMFLHQDSAAGVI